MCSRAVSYTHLDVYKRQALRCAGHFDRYICRRDDNPRGRGPDEVPRLLAAALTEGGVSAEAIEVIPDEQEAVETALRRAEAGDLLLIFGDKVSRTWKQIIYFAPDAETPRSDLAPQAMPFEPEEAPRLTARERKKLIRDDRGVWLPAEPEEAD